eukprot:687335-Prymnesium_polylepis.2
MCLRSCCAHTCARGRQPRLHCGANLTVPCFPSRCAHSCAATLSRPQPLLQPPLTPVAASGRRRAHVQVYCLFATHYLQLANLKNLYPSHVKLLQLAVEQAPTRLIYKYKIEVDAPCAAMRTHHSRAPITI